MVCEKCNISDNFPDAFYCHYCGHPLRKWAIFFKSKVWAIFFFLLFVISTIFALYYFAKLKQVKNEKFADIENVWQRHNIVNENGLKGMEIYVQFITDGMLDKQGTVVVWFFDNNGNILIANDNSELRYKSIGNYLSVAENFITCYADSIISDDFVLFMPYNNFDDLFKTSTQGKVDLLFRVGIFDDREKQIAISEYHSFYYSW